MRKNKQMLALELSSSLAFHHKLRVLEIVDFDKCIVHDATIQFHVGSHHLLDFSNIYLLLI